MLLEASQHVPDPPHSVARPRECFHQALRELSSQPEIGVRTPSCDIERKRRRGGRMGRSSDGPSVGFVLDLKRSSAIDVRGTYKKCSVDQLPSLMTRRG